MPKSLISSMATMSTHAKRGDFPAVMSLFDKMRGSGLEPYRITFLVVLMACGGEGTVGVGRRVFDVMVSEHRYGLDLQPEHYSCMVDAGEGRRAGQGRSAASEGDTERDGVLGDAELVGVV